MVLARPARRGARGRARGRRASAVAAPGFVNLTHGAGLLAAAGARWCWRPGRTTAAATLGARPAGQCRVLLGQPDRARCMSATAAARCSATRWPRCWRMPAIAVTREYYINDGGAQIETLARSLHLRYREALGEDDRDDPAGPLSRRLPDPGRRGDRRARRRPVARGARGRVAASRSSASASTAMMRADPRGSRGARRPPRRLHLASAT